MKEKLDVVNEDDKVIDVKTRKEVHDKKLRHRSVMFFVFREDGKLLMTKRSADKRFFPGYWSIVLGGHVPSGYDYEEALEKEMEEELGVSAEYEELGSFTKEIKEEKENVKLFRTVVRPEEIELSAEEFEEGLFISIERLNSEMEEKPFLPETKMVLEYLENSP